MTRPVDAELSATDFFCGAGGSSTGLSRAGFTIAVAMNHWQRAMQTHGANHPGTDHICEDIAAYDLRALPRTSLLWASPICTEASPSGKGSKPKMLTRKQREEMEKHGHVPQDGFVRTRTTFAQVIEAVRYHHYDAVVIENVVDVASKWVDFDAWVDEMEAEGYFVQFVSVSAAHIYGPDNPPAPQWRDRLYLVFTRIGIPLPDLEPRPYAHCPSHGLVAARQWWKKDVGRRKVGKYRAQYLYRCPDPACALIVEPLVLPASAIIDWSHLGTPIGDRPKMSPNTIRRVLAGLRMFGRPALVAAAGNTWERPGSGYVRAWPADNPMTARTCTVGDGLATPPEDAFLMAVNHSGSDPRAYPAAGGALPARTTHIGEGIVVPAGTAFTLDRKDERGAHASRLRNVVSDALNTITGNDRTSRCLVTSPEQAAVIALRSGNRHTGTAEPVPTVTGAETLALANPPGVFVIPNRTGGRARGVQEPLPTVLTGTNLGIGAAPWVTTLRHNGSSTPVDTPLATLTASGKHHAVVVPPGAIVTRHYTTRDGNDGYLSRLAADQPLGTLTASSGNQSLTVPPAGLAGLVVPYRKAHPTRVDADPLHTLATVDSAALVTPSLNELSAMAAAEMEYVLSCLFRMLEPSESMRGQRFPWDYVVHGNRGEQAMQAGNAVANNVAQWIGAAVAASLNYTYALAG